MDFRAFPTLTELDERLPVYLVSVGHWDHQEPTYRANGHPDYQWLQTVSGRGKLQSGDREWTILPGQGFCLYPHEPHAYFALEENWDVYWISFRGSLASPLLQRTGLAGTGVYHVTEPERIASLIGEIYKTTQSSKDYGGIDYSQLLYTLLLELMKTTAPGSQAAEWGYARLRPVLQYMERHYDRPVTIKELADYIAVTPQYLCQLFKRALHMRPMEYMNRERINRSKELMFQEGGIRLYEVAERVGFESASYYSSVFKRLEGMSPDQFKRIHGLK
ncbi:AraC family transcriptional regulator [Paenibacillus chungangensis]|uniref:AraC family transcriptional regulator n=1 Tax=Paenibacillus chungangensis TaxID=696535 RepID=A0ABW3HLQ5_9BACL